MNEAPFGIVRLNGAHDRSTFHCGIESLDRYFRQLVSQDARRRIATCFVMAENETGAIAGYYTLAATGVLLRELPEDIAARLPRHNLIPGALIGRLAIAAAFQGRKLGAALLFDAVARVVRSDVAAFAILVDPIDDRARSFYRHHGFLDLPGPERRMFVPTASIAGLIR